MGIFGDDKRQDEQIAALEEHVRALTETVLANQTDIATLGIALFELKGQVDEKVSAEDVDPTLVKLNEDLASARVELEKAEAATAESWTTLQKGVTSSFETLRTSVRQAYDQLKKS
jgi:hypothetical protein